MKRLVWRFSYTLIIRIALLGFMLSAIINLSGDIRPVSTSTDCPVTMDYEVKHINLIYGIGAKYLYTYTVSFNPKQVTKRDEQRIYTLDSKLFPPGKMSCGYTSVSSDIRDGQTFTYTQFPITGHLVVKFTGYNEYPEELHLPSPGEFSVSVSGSALKGDPLWILIEDGPMNWQFTRFNMPLPDPGDYAFLVKVFRLKTYFFLIFIVALVIFILYHIKKRVIHQNRIKAG